MRNKLRSLCCGTLLMTAYACTTVYTKPDAPINEVPFTQVHLNDSFWILVLRRIGSYLFPLHLKNARRTVASITLPLQED